METHAPQTTSSSNTTNFSVGETVIYPLHGKCQITGLETKVVGGQSLSFYKVEVVRSAFARTTRKDPAIWIPVNSAVERGLRRPLTPEAVTTIWTMLENREYYFSASDSWAVVQPKLEAAIRNDGAEGLAKVASYLHALKKRLIVPPSEVAKMYETVTKLLTRELSDVTGEQVRSIEERMQKSMRHKNLPDH
jgi:RNA polymerase-interacting CarD/CdnL/TRCF family regulator